MDVGRVALKNMQVYFAPVVIAKPFKIVGGLKKSFNFIYYSKYDQQDCRRR